MEAQIAQFSNAELYEKLKFYGIAKGPVTVTTRSLYERKLVQYLKESKIPSSSASVAATGGDGSMIVPGIQPATYSPPKAAQSVAPVKQPSPVSLPPTRRPDPSPQRRPQPDVVDITPSRNTIRIQTDYDPLSNSDVYSSNNNNNNRQSTSYSTSTNIITSRTSTRTAEPSSHTAQQQPQKMSSEFKLLRDPVPSSAVSSRQSNSSINITPLHSTASSNDGVRLRQATQSTFISDQLDQARQQEHQYNQSVGSSSSSNTVVSSGSNWRLVTIIAVVIVIILLFYNFFLTNSPSDELEELV